jgi:hypothetical protein
MAYEPVERESWAYRTAGAHKALKEGKLPTKFHWDKRAAFRQVGLLMTSALSEFLGIVNTIIAPNHPLPYQKPTAADRMRILLDNGGKLSQSTLDKSHEPVAKGFIRIACESQSQSQALMLCRAVSQSFRDLDGDNEFIRMNIPQKKVRRFLMDMERNRVPSIGGSTFSVGELATLHRLPTGPLQDLYPQINNIDTRENAIPEVLRSGIPIGYGKYRGLTILVCRPTHNRDDLLLPWALFGGSGWGKTTSLANLALELVLLGYTVFHIDVSGGQALFDVINHLPESVPGDHIHMRDYNHGVYMPSVAWTEPGAYMQDSENPRRVANSLTGALIDFLIQTTDEQGNQTGNLLSALCLAAFSTYPGSLMHVVKCATSEKVCRECMQNLENPFALQVLNDYWSLSDNMRANNFRPVMSRLGQLLSDENISSAMLQEPVLDADGKPATDYRRWSDEGGHYVPINVPSDPSALGKIAADQITALEAHKVFLSVLTRPLPEQSRKPAFLLLDEPHQFPSVMAVFSRILLEGRKHGLGCITAFHDWRLVPKNFRSSFLAATCNYAAMKCSKDMLDDIGDAFRPFDDREIMELPKYHAVLRMVANGQDQTPLLVKLIEPPSQRYQFVDRSARIEECARTYGRPITEIQQWIYEQYMQAQTETKPKGRR